MNMSKKLNLKNVIFTGYLPEEKLIELYQRSHVFVCASKTETQGIVTLEAMSYRCPVIVSNSLGFKDFVKNNVNGILCNRSEEFVEKIIEITTNKKLRRKITKNGYKTAQKYTIDKCARKLEDVYEGLTGGKK